MSQVFGHGRLRLYLLRLLDEAPRHGYEIIRLLEDRFMGLYSPSAGTVYPRLARLEEEGLISRDESSGRKIYSITDAGRAELAARAEDLASLEEDIAGSVHALANDVREQVRSSVRDLRAELKGAARDVSTSGRDLRAELKDLAREVQREDRHTGREAKRGAPDIERLVNDFRDQARRELRGRALDADALARARAVLDDALVRLRETLNRRPER